MHKQLNCFMAERLKQNLQNNSQSQNKHFQNSLNYVLCNNFPYGNFVREGSWNFWKLTFLGHLTAYMKFYLYNAILDQEKSELRTSGTGRSAIWRASSIHAVNTGWVTNCSGRWNCNRSIIGKQIAYATQLKCLINLTTTFNYWLM